MWSNKPIARKINSEWYYLIYNGHNDVIMILDESGNIKNTYNYDVWGNITSKTETVPNPIRYAGEYQDEKTGLYYDCDITRV